VKLRSYSQRNRRVSVLFPAETRRFSWLNLWKKRVLKKKSAFVWPKVGRRSRSRIQDTSKKSLGITDLQRQPHGRRQASTGSKSTS